MSHGGQTESLLGKGRGLELYSTSQHSVTRWSDRKPVRKEAGLTALFHQSTQCHTVVRWKALRKEAGLRDLFHQSTQCTTVVRWKALEKRRGLELYSTSQHSVTWWSDGKPVRKGAGLRALFHQSTQCHTVVGWKACEERGGA